MNRTVSSNRTIWSFILCSLTLCVLTAFGAATPAWAAEGDYQIYPTPHAVTYAEGTQTLRKEANVVLEDGIDADTEARLNESLALKGMKAKKAKRLGSKRSTNILVGVKGSNGVVDTMVTELTKSGELTVADDLFSKTDAYLLASLPAKGDTPDRVIVLGASTDAAYYGLTTLYQILQQTDGASLRAFTVADYADVITRGFIEGYYGNPWSTEDRVNLMKWGGYYKLNAYVYAPKDDPKHNAQWRTLYTEEELTEKIDPLAKAGNESKCRFVYALHPFMSNPITNANYDDSVAILKEKFTQVMDHGVRQIAILADDAGNQGNALYIKLCTDMTNWIHEQQKATNEDGSLKYPGLKDTIIFCPVNYMGYGEAWYSDLPDNIQVVNTGGRVWGKIDNNFASTFQNNSGVAPFMWINWPCSDNDKDALHMGGHNNFLGSDLKPGQVKGVVLNPMQQSEPSKQAIFMNADLTWNLWTSTDHADQAWEDSFSYVDHNSPVATAGSDALKALSGHALRMYGGGATWENGESADIKDALTAFRTKLASGTVTEDDVDSMTAIFTELKEIAASYRASAGNKDMLEQISYWVDAMEEQSEAALLELEAVKADLAGDKSTLIAKYSEGTAKLDDANNHGYLYIDHTEYARIGKAHIVPTINALDTYVAERAELASNPDANFTKFVTSRTDSPSAKTDVLFDGKANTGLSYKDPATITEGTFFGVEKTNAFDLDRFTITYDGGHLNDTLRTGKLQVLKETDNGREWVDVEGKTLDNNREQVVDFKDLGQKDVFGVRLIATADNEGACWLTINEIEINKVDGPASESATYFGTVTLEKQVSADNSKPLGNASDGKDGTEAWLTHGVGDQKDDGTEAGAAVIVTFDGVKSIDTVVFKQAISNNGGDAIDNGTAYYQTADGQWHEAGAINNKTAQTIKLGKTVDAKAIKVVNNARKEIWWRVVDLYATAGEEATAAKTISTNMPQYQSNAIARAIDGDETTQFWSSRNTQQGDWVMMTLGGKVKIDTVRALQGSSDKFSSASVYYTTDETPNAASGTWTKACDLSGSADETKSFVTVEATAIKLVSNSGTSNWFQLYELEAYERYSFSADSIYSTFELPNASLKGRVTTDGASTTDATVKLPANGDVIAVDLGGIRREVTVAAGETAATKADAVYSMNGLEWKSLGSEAVSARYVGYKANAGDASVAFKGYTVSFLGSLAPKLVSSDVSGSDSFDVAKVFDGNIGTNSTIAGYPSEGNKIVFDLGQERAINTFEYFIPETSKDFIRNGVIEVANDPNAADGQWTQVLDINSKEIVENEYNEDTAKNAAWLTHSSEVPGNMTAKAENLDVTGRYLRIRFTGTYSHRWICLGELRINKGEYVSTYAGGDFESTVAEQRDMLPSNMIDKNLESQWAPSGDTAGTLTYHVSTPLKADGTAYEGVRIISRGNPSGATVKAVLYTDGSYSATETVTLGTLDQNSQEFRFGNVIAATRAAVNFTAVKDVVIEWPAGTTPQISEIYLLGKAAGAGTDSIAALRTALDTAKKADTSTWTANSKAALDTAVAAAEGALANDSAITADAAASLKAGLENAVANKVVRYAGTELSELVEGAIKDGSAYTKTTWDAYSQALAAATEALKDADNISETQGEELAANLKAARENLVFDATAADRAALVLEDAKELKWGEGDFTTSSKASYDEALSALQKLVDDGVKDPAQLNAAMDNLFAARDGLVDVSALLAAQAEFEGISEGAYTPDSYAQYKAAYEASKKLLEDGTAEQIAEAVQNLADAQAKLVAVDLDGVLADAKKLNKDDYTSDSWKVLDAAIKAAEAEHEDSENGKLAQAIVDARAQLVNVVALKDAIARAEAIDTSVYTDQSVAALKDAVAAGKALLKSGTADEVEAARADILAKIDGLTRPSTPGDGGSGDTGNSGNAGNAGGSNKPGNTGKPGTGGSLAQTGDNTLVMVGGFIVVAVIVIAAGVVLARKNKR